MTAYSFIANASIESATFDIERGFILTGWLHLNFKGGSQGFGGYVLGGIGDALCADHANQPNLMAIWLAGLLQAAGVEQFSGLPGKVIRIAKDDEYGTIKAIGHAIKDDHWFDPGSIFGAMTGKREGVADRPPGMENLRNTLIDLGYDEPALHTADVARDVIIRLHGIVNTPIPKEAVATTE